MPSLTYLNPKDNTEVNIQFSNSFREFLLGGNVEGKKVPMEIRLLFQNLFSIGTSPAYRTPYLALRPDGMPTMNYFSIRRGDAPVVSYLQWGKEQKLKADGGWVRKGRQTMKPGRWLNAFINAETQKRYNITDVTKERFSNEIRAFCDNSAEVKIVSGADILKFYGRDSMADSKGSLGGSCMVYEGKNPPAHRFKVYTDNPNCAMLVAVNKNDKLMARAILWLNCDCLVYEKLNGSAYGDAVKNYRVLRHERHDMLDRIYTQDTWLVALMEQYASEHGIYYKNTRVANADYYTGFTNPEGKLENIMFRVDTGGADRNGWPYFDTMRYSNTVQNRIYNHTDTIYETLLKTAPPIVEKPVEVPQAAVEPNPRVKHPDLPMGNPVKGLSEAVNVLLRPSPARMAAARRAVRDSKGRFASKQEREMIAIMVDYLADNK